jgi:hypothetical protein
MTDVPPPEPGPSAAPYLTFPGDTTDAPRRRLAGRGMRSIGFGLAAAVVTLVIIGQVIFLARALGSGVWNASDSSALVPTHGTLTHRLQVALGAALGGGDRGVRRFEVVRIAPSGSQSKLSTVNVRWAINDDISAGTVGNGAQDDVYAAFRDVFSAGLPLASVRLDGTYPMSDRHGSTRETVVIRVAMSRSTAATIGRIGWENLDPQTAWPLIDRLYVNPQFQPLPQG